MQIPKEILLDKGSGLEQLPAQESKCNTLSNVTFRLKTRKAELLIGVLILDQQVQCLSSIGLNSKHCHWKEKIH